MATDEKIDLNLLNAEEEACRNRLATVSGIRAAHRAIPDLESRKSQLQTEIQQLDQKFFEKERLLREITGKVDHEKIKCEEWTKKAEDARVELSSVQSSLNAAKAEKAALKAAL
jgi:chromosome segregation ATPase